jgi:hypothetical protein
MILDTLLALVVVAVFVLTLMEAADHFARLQRHMFGGHKPYYTEVPEDDEYAKRKKTA